MITFKEKCFGAITKYIVDGAVLGSMLGAGTAIPIMKKTSKNKQVRFRGKNIPLIPAVGTIGGALIGAALGALAYGIKEASSYVSNAKISSSRIMPVIVKNLENLGHKEGMSFTRDPRRADLLKTKVNIVVYKFSGELRIVVNMANDKKLESLMNKSISQLSKTGEHIIKEEISGSKYKDIKIATISEASTKEDAEYVTYIADKFINSGYPVYLVEVG